MSFDLYLGCLMILSMAAIIIISLTTTRSGDRQNDQRSSIHSGRSDNEEVEENAQSVKR